MKTFAVEIEGCSPGLLMNKFSLATQASLEDEVKPTVRNYGTAAEQAERAAYRDDEGHLCAPGEAIYQAMCKVASQFQIKGRGKKTYKDAVKGNVVIEPEFIPHEANEYEVDSRYVRIGTGRSIRHRPRLRRWSLAFTIQLVGSEAVPLAVLNHILVRAGESVGIGDYRPRFGRFTVTKFKAVAT